MRCATAGRCRTDVAAERLSGHRASCGGLAFANPGTGNRSKGATGKDLAISVWFNDAGPSAFKSERHGRIPGDEGRTIRPAPDRMRATQCAEFAGS